MRLVATCTTLPDRYDYLLRMLKSLHNQTVKPDVIYVTMPYRAKRLNKEYPPLPKKIQKLCTVVRCEKDYGPICKLYGALVSERDPNTLILSVDDDTIYDKDLIKVLLEKHALQPNAAVTGTGWLVGNTTYFSMKSSISLLNKFNGLVGMYVPNEGRKIDVLVGSAGVLYQRRFFPRCHLEKLFNLSELNDDMFKNDDIVISAFLCSRKIERYVFNKVPTTNSDDCTIDALSFNYLKMLQSFERCVKYCKEIELFISFEEYCVSDSPIFKAIFLIILILLIIVICSVVKYYQD